VAYAGAGRGSLASSVTYGNADRVVVIRELPVLLASAQVERLHLWPRVTPGLSAIRGDAEPRRGLTDHVAHETTRIEYGTGANLNCTRGGMNLQSMMDQDD
jgi:hypothetical protein